MKIILKKYIFSFSTAVIPSGDGVYRTIFRGPRHENYINKHDSLTDKNNQNLFDASRAGVYYDSEKVTYSHPAELVRC